MKFDIKDCDAIDKYLEGYDSYHMFPMTKCWTIDESLSFHIYANISGEFILFPTPRKSFRPTPPKYLTKEEAFNYLAEHHKGFVFNWDLF